MENNFIDESKTDKLLSNLDDHLSFIRNKLLYIDTLPLNIRELSIQEINEKFTTIDLLLSSLKNCNLVSEYKKEIENQRESFNKKYKNPIRSTITWQNSLTTIDETEKDLEQGIEKGKFILNEMDRQRGVMDNIRDRLANVQDQIGNGNQILYSIKSVLIKNKIILLGILGVLFFIFVLIFFLKFS